MREGQKISSVSEFYDRFLESRMIRYRTHGNRRLDVAKKLLVSQVRPGDTVADIGCGIGIISEAIARSVPDVKVIGVDVSKGNIEYAKRTVHRKNVEFFQVDVTDQFDCLRSLAPQGYDVVTLIDVIEHIPELKRTGLFADLERISHSNTRLVLAYPSPKYQCFLKAHNPQELQIIDNIVEIGDLIKESREFGWSLSYFEHKDIWLKRQYVHCVFDRIGDESMEAVVMGWTAKALQKAQNIALFPYRTWYYERRLRKR